MKENPNITQYEISLEISKSRPTVLRAIKLLINEGKVKRIGSRKGGHWQVIES